jgi:hypothetical protein
MFFWTKFQSATKGHKVERKEQHLKRRKIDHVNESEFFSTSEEKAMNPF